MRRKSDPHITLEQTEDGGFVAPSGSLPGFVAHGQTEGAAIRRMKRALKLNFREQERDFIRIATRDGTESFRWSRFRAPLYLQLPLSRPVKINLAAFGLGFALGATATVLSTRR